MGLPINVTHDPIAQATWGLVGESINNPRRSGLALITFGFLWNSGDWAACFDAVTTSWTLCAQAVTTNWTLCYADVVTTWTACSEFD